MTPRVRESTLSWLRLVGALGAALLAVKVLGVGFLAVTGNMVVNRDDTQDAAIRAIESEHHILLILLDSTNAKLNLEMDYRCDHLGAEMSPTVAAKWRRVCAR